jgi:hypothetical protein
MLALWVASSKSIRRWPIQILLGLVLCVAVLTKTNAVIAMPAVLYLMWSTQSCYLEAAAKKGWMRPVGRYVLSGLLVCGTMGLFLIAWFEVAVRPHHLAEAVQVFTLNNFHGSGWQLLRAGLRTLKTAGLLLQPVEFSAAMLFVLLAMAGFRQLWRIPVFTAFVLLAAGEVAFIAYHSPWVPRYYQTLVMPMTVVACVGSWSVLQRCGRWPRLLLRTGWCLTVAVMAVQTLQSIAHPQYTYLHTTESIAAIVREDSGVQPRTYGATCGAITLMTGVTSVCDFGLTVSPAQMVDRYHPGWYVMLMPDEGPKPSPEDLGPRYAAEKRAEYQVFDLNRYALWLMRITPR